MKLRFRLNMNDIVAYYEQVRGIRIVETNASEESPSLFFFVPAFLWVCIILVVLMAIGVDVREGHFIAIIAVVSLVFAFFKIRGDSRTMSRKMLDRRYESPEGRAALEERTYEITEQGISMSDEHTSYSFQWPGIERVEELKSLFLIHVSARVEFFIPHRVFIDEEELEQFKSLLKYHNKPEEKIDSKSDLHITKEPKSAPQDASPRQPGDDAIRRKDDMF